MSLGAPWLLILLFVVAVMTLLAARFERWRRRARGDFAGPQASRWQTSLNLAATIILLEATALIVIGMARPQWGATELTRERQGVDLVIVLDISQSMQATDADPTRIAQSQSQLSRLVEAERGNRFGLVLFAGTSILRSPLTADAGAMSELLQRASNEGGLVRTGSDIGVALDQAAIILSGSESAGKAVLLVSDGEDFGGTFADKARSLRENNVLVLVAGAGTTNGSQLTDTLRNGTTRPKVDASGQPVVSRLNETNLRTIADSGGGRYLRMSGNNDLLGFREDLSRLERTPLGAETSLIPIQRFQVFVAAALALLLLSWFVPLRFRLRVPSLRLRRLQPNAGVAMLLVALVVGGCSGGETLRSRNQAGNEAYNRHSYREALDIYQELIAMRPDVPELSYNAGNALHRANLYVRAVEATQRALPPSNDRIGAITYYALGNHYFALEEYELAYDSYRRALLLDPADADTKNNLELTYLILTGQVENPADNQGQQPGPGEPGQAGDGEQQPGDEGEPGDQPAQPEATPSDGSQPAQPGGSPTPGQAPTEPTAAEIQRELEDALRGINETLTFEEAQRILDLLQQQQQREGLPGGGTSPSGPDY